MEASLFAEDALRYVSRVRLVDFLIMLLEAHAQTLQRLAALFGEEIFLHMLEESGDEEPRVGPGAKPKTVLHFDPNWFDGQAAASSGFSSPYMELEGAVHEFSLPAMFEFHLWAYPHYRAFIESPLELNSKIQGPGGEAGLALVEEAVAQASAWLKHLPIAPEFVPQAESVAHVPWLRFRTAVLKKIGKRPLGPVY